MTSRKLLSLATSLLTKQQRLRENCPWKITPGNNSVSSSFDLWWRGALSSHCPPSLRYETCPLSLGEAGSTPPVCYAPSAARAAIPTCLTARVMQMWEAAIPLPSLVCCSIQRVFSHPAQSLIPTFSSTHASTASTKANQITPEVNAWAYQQSKESVSAAVFHPSCWWKMCFLFHRTFSNDPVGHFVDHISEWQSAYNKFSKWKVLRRRRIVTSCPLFSGNEKGILENFHNSIKATWILRTDCQKWQPKKDWEVQCLFSWLNLS